MAKKAKCQFECQSVNVLQNIRPCPNFGQLEFAIEDGYQYTSNSSC